MHRPWKYAIASALITTATLSGALVLGFGGGNVLFESLQGMMTGFLSGLASLPLVIGVFLGGGALWGYGMAKLTGSDTKKLAKSGAVSYLTIVVVTGVLLELVFAFVLGFSKVVRLPLHVYFTLVFTPTAGLIAGLLAQRIARWTGREEIKSQLAKTSGLTATAGFLLVNLVMFALGWEVGGPGAAERYTMITVMLSSTVGAGLAGGGVLGWGLGIDMN